MTLVADKHPISRRPIPATRAARRMVVGPVAADRPACRDAAAATTGR